MQLIFWGKYRDNLTRNREEGLSIFLSVFGAGIHPFCTRSLELKQNSHYYIKNYCSNLVSLPFFECFAILGKMFMKWIGALPNLIN